MNYDFIAPYYQIISRIIFGKTLLKAQLKTIDFINKNDCVLIVGAGDGSFLTTLEKQAFQKLTFVDSSQKMIEIARTKTKDKRIEFLNIDVLNHVFEESFDVIVFPFLLDNFTNEQVEQVMLKIDPILRRDLIVIDYTENQNLWQKILLKTMYLFFKIIAQIKVNKLPKIEEIINQNGFIKTYETSFYRNFIKFKVYKRIKNMKYLLMIFLISGYGFAQDISKSYVGCEKPKGSTMKKICYSKNINQLYSSYLESYVKKYQDRLPSGNAAVRFIITKDGNVSNIQIVDSSNEKFSKLGLLAFQDFLDDLEKYKISFKPIKSKETQEVIDFEMKIPYSLEFN